MRNLSFIISLVGALTLMCGCTQRRERPLPVYENPTETESPDFDINTETIRNDLIGRTITGVDTGFITTKTKMTLTDNNLQNIIITGRSEENGATFIEADLTIKSENDGSFLGHVTLEYRPGENRPDLIMVQSRGIEFILTGRYLSCISYTINNQPGEESVTLHNSADHDMAVGGYYLAKDDTWKKFCVTVPGYGDYELGCWFMETARDIHLEFAELP